MALLNDAQRDAIARSIQRPLAAKPSRDHKQFHAFGAA